MTKNWLTLLISSWVDDRVRKFLALMGASLMMTSSKKRSFDLLFFVLLLLSSDSLSWPDATNIALTYRARVGKSQWSYNINVIYIRIRNMTLSLSEYRNRHLKKEFCNNHQHLNSNEWICNTFQKNTMLHLSSTQKCLARMYNKLSI